eukprot:g50028.t1
MRCDEYNRLGKQISSKGHIFVVTDPNPGGFVKFDAYRFFTALREIRKNLNSWLPRNIARHGKEEWKFVIGGHSAGGQAAANALMLSSTQVHGFFALDPFNCKSIDPTVRRLLQRLPTVIWGFQRTTCGVTTDLAASLLYLHLAVGSRVEGLHALYLVDNTAESCPTWNHCGFTDHGCDGGQEAFLRDYLNQTDRTMVMVDVCNIQPDCAGPADQLTKAVAMSAHLLAQRVQSPEKRWTHSQWVIHTPVSHSLSTTGKTSSTEDVFSISTVAPTQSEATSTTSSAAPARPARAQPTSKAVKFRNFSSFGNFSSPFGNFSSSMLGDFASSWRNFSSRVRTLLKRPQAGSLKS